MEAKLAPVCNLQHEILDVDVSSKEEKLSAR
jgi:hypothetical protein